MEDIMRTMNTTTEGELEGAEDDDVIDILARRSHTPTADRPEDDEDGGDGDEDDADDALADELFGPSAEYREFQGSPARCPEPVIPEAGESVASADDPEDTPDPREEAPLRELPKLDDQTVESLRNDFVSVHREMMEEQWPSNPEAYMKAMAEDMDVIVEMFERLMGHSHGVRVPISDMMAMTSRQTRLFVKNAISDAPTFEIAMKADYMLVHTFATMVRSYKDKTDKLGGISKVPYFRRTAAPVKPGTRRRREEVCETDAESAWETAAETDVETVKKASPPPSPVEKPTPPAPIRPMTRNEIRETAPPPVPRKSAPPSGRVEENGTIIVEEPPIKTEADHAADKKDPRRRRKKKRQLVRTSDAPLSRTGNFEPPDEECCIQ